MTQSWHEQSGFKLPVSELPQWATSESGGRAMEMAQFKLQCTKLPKKRKKIANSPESIYKDQKSLYMYALELSSKLSNSYDGTSDCLSKSTRGWTLAWNGVQDEFDMIVTEIKNLGRNNFLDLQSYTLKELKDLDSKIIQRDFETEFARLRDIVKKCSNLFLSRFGSISLEQMAVFGVFKDFCDSKKSQDIVKAYNKSGLAYMQPYVQLSEPEATALSKERIHAIMQPYQAYMQPCVRPSRAEPHDLSVQRRNEQCGSKDFYRSLLPCSSLPSHISWPAQHPIHQYFSSASILPCSVDRTKIRILMTVADKYEKSDDWSDSKKSSDSPFNFPCRKGKRMLCFLGGKRQHEWELPHETALREFKEETGSVPERIPEELENFNYQKEVWCVGWRVSSVDANLNMSLKETRRECGCGCGCSFDYCCEIGWLWLARLG